MSASREGREPLVSIRDRVQASVVGWDRELGLVLATVAAGRDILLKGPPGTSKSTLPRAITYQDAAAERGVVALRAPLPDLKPALYERLVADAVAVTRATRAHQDIRQGSSVRGAIDLTLVAGQLFDLSSERPVAPQGPASSNAPGAAEAAEQSYHELVYDAMVVVLSGRIVLDETVEATPEQVLREIWEDRFILDPAAATPG